MAKDFKVSKLIMDHDTPGGNIACSVFPEVRIQTTPPKLSDKINTLQGKYVIKCAIDLHS